MRAPRTRRSRLVAAVAFVALVAAVAVGSRSDPVGRVSRLAARVNPGHVVSGSWTPLSFTVRAGTAGIQGGVLTLAVPPRWPAPSRSADAAGYVRASVATVATHGRVASVKPVNLPPHGRLTLTYGGGLGGATEPVVGGTYAFTLQVASPLRGDRAGRRVAVQVRPPRSGCHVEINPTGAGQTLLLPNGAARPNVYNAGVSSGELVQCYGARGATTRIRLTSASARRSGPLGYPELAYGNDLLNDPFCRTCHSQPFPLRVSALLGSPRAYRLSASYELMAAAPPSLVRNLMYDLWLERDPIPGVAPRPGDVEVLVILYHVGRQPCVDGMPTSRLTTRGTFDGRSVITRWTVCRILGGTPATPVAFLLTSPAESPHATISIPPAVFVDSAGRFLGQDLRPDSLLGIELGSEFGACSDPRRCAGGRSAWSWRVSQLTLVDTAGVIPIVFPGAG